VAERPRLIVIGALPPPHHGVTISTALVLANKELQRRFRIEHLDTSDHRSVANVGRWDPRNALEAISVLARLVMQLQGERGLVYLPISQGLPGLTRDTFFIRLAALWGWTVVGHLRGSELADFYRNQPALVRAWLRRAFDRVHSMAVLGDSIRGAVAGVVRPERVAVVPNGTPDPGLVRRVPGARMGLFLSNFLRRKGPLEAMKAALLVVREDPTARFVFAGDSHERSVTEELNRLARQGSGRIEVRSSLTGKGKREVLASSAFLLFPPVEPEGHPRVVLEAMAAGLPVITTDRGAIAETVVDGVCGYIVRDPDPAQLADRILRLLGDDELQTSMSQAARARYLERFTQEAADAALSNWLTRVAGADGRPDSRCP
jgi:glycosyltransferase involved in cell wall biosynthesis